MSSPRSWSALRVGLLAIFVVLANLQPSRADVTFRVEFDDPGSLFTSYYDVIESNVLAAGDRWASVLASGGPVELTVSIGFDPGIPTANGGSVTSSFSHHNGTHWVYDQGAAAMIRDGIDPNGAAPDIRFNIGHDYLVNELWFDPNPSSRIETVPIDRTDAVSVFLHEFGHAIGFNGWRNVFDGSLPGDYMSTFDELVTFDGSDFWFVGTAAMNVYGGPVPLTYGNIFHLGNAAPRPGSDLIGPPDNGGDLMNGVVFYRGGRYDITPLNLAVLSDIGVQVVPEPSSVVLLGLGLAVAVRLRYRRARAA